MKLDIIESTRTAVHDTAGIPITIATLSREPTAREEAELHAMGIFEWHCVSAPKKEHLIRSFPQTSAPVPTKTNYTFLVVAIVISFVITMVILFGGL